MTRPSLHDRMALLALKLAKRNKRHYELASDNDFYDEFFQPHHLLQYQQDLRTVLRHEQILSAVQELPENSQVLDLGCGVGHILNLLPNLFRSVGLDYSLASLRLAKRMVKDRFLVNGSGYELPFADSSFDAITCFEVLEHMESDSRVVSEIARVLRPGGRLIASVPGHYYFEEYRDLMGHYRHYTPESFADLLNQHGLEVFRFLNGYRRFNFFYFYFYVLLEGINLIWNKITRGSKSIYERRVPFTNKGLYRSVIAPVLLRMRRFDERGTARPETFVVARKVCAGLNEIAVRSGDAVSVARQ